MMKANVYKMDGTVARTAELPRVFETRFREDMVRRALLSEQSRKYQPQGRAPLAGINTSATYVGKYNAYRALRHVGLAIRPRQKLAGGAMGEVRRIPSARKGRRAHPQKVEKILVERINGKEYAKAIQMAVAATADVISIKKRFAYKADSLPIIVSNEIEKVARTKDLIKVLNALGLKAELDRSHKPKLKNDSRRLAAKRHFRNSLLIVAKDSANLEKAGRNIAGVDVISIESMTIQKLAPGAAPRIALWSEAAIEAVGTKLEKMMQ